jgi:dolichol kinase
LAGSVFGSTKVPRTGGKTLQGSLTCFLAVFAVTFGLTRRLLPSVAIAVSATALELLPTGDFDNIVLPVGTGLVALLLTPLMGAFVPLL